MGNSLQGHNGTPTWLTIANAYDASGGPLARQAMAQEYLVMRRSAQWWVTLDGQRLGPHASQAVAVAAAIALAKLDARTGRAARVSVDDSGQVPVVFDSINAP